MKFLTGLYIGNKSNFNAGVKVTSFLHLPTTTMDPVTAPMMTLLYTRERNQCNQKVMYT